MYNSPENLQIVQVVGGGCSTCLWCTAVVGLGGWRATADVPCPAGSGHLGHCTIVGACLGIAGGILDVAAVVGGGIAAAVGDTVVAVVLGAKPPSVRTLVACAVPPVLHRLHLAPSLSGPG